MNRILTGDALGEMAKMEAESVHCVVTSPPYWGLRDYGVEGQLGLEPTPDLYIENLVQIFREVRRVLRRDGTLWLNMGDSYAGSGKGIGSDHGKAVVDDAGYGSKVLIPFGLKPKDLCGIPWRVAFALQADGWWLRSDIIWAKPNPMPESVTDRPTKAHEYVFLMSKAARYYYDQEAVREEIKDSNTGSCSARPSGDSKTRDKEHWGIPHEGRGNVLRTYATIKGANRKSVWTIPTAPFPEAHFATFPPALVEPCIKAGTSEWGVCPECGKPWERIIERTDEKDTSAKGSRFDQGKTGARDGGDRTQAGERNLKATLGWRPGCTCGKEPTPATVLDPFFGAGTVGLVAARLGRSFIGIELNPDYCEMARRRIEADAPLMTRVEVR